LALRVRAEAVGTDARLARLVALTLGRDPTSEETSILSGLFTRFRAEAVARPAESAKLVGRGLAPGVDPAEAAAWTALARTVLNLDEFLTRE
jgi:hypothetical protein